MDGHDKKKKKKPPLNLLEKGLSVKKAAIMILQGHRASVIRLHTGLTAAQLLSLSRELAGKYDQTVEPMKGRLPMSQKRFASLAGHMNASILCNIYLRAMGCRSDDHDSLKMLILDLEVLNAAFFKARDISTSKSDFSLIHSSYKIVADLVEGSIYMETCRQCGFSFALHVSAGPKRSCPLCAIQRRAGQQHGN